MVSVLHGPAECSFPIILTRHDIVDALLRGLCLREANRSHLWHGEHGPRHETAVAGDHRVRVKQIMLYDSSVLVGNMLELLLRAHVTQRKDPLGASSLVVVNNDQPVVVHIDPSARQVESVAVRCPAGGDQQHIRLEAFLCSLYAAEMYADPPVWRRFDELDTRFQTDIHPPPEQFGEAL